MGAVPEGLSADELVEAEIFPLDCRPPTGADARLGGWRDNVGDPVALDLAPEAGAERDTLLVLSWNMWIGRGDLPGLIARIRGGEYEHTGFPAGIPLVVLIQEAYRAGESVPIRPNGRTARDFSRRGRNEHEIEAVAREAGLNLRYAPSMRNGTHRSDRGNAILSTLPLLDAVATELPFAFQRRVAVSASIAHRGRKLRVHSAHLDPRGGSARDILGIAGRLSQARVLIEAMSQHAGSQILGADLNLARQRREPAFAALAAAGFHPGVPRRLPSWSHTYHRLPRLILDWLLVSAGAEIGSVRVQRLDEHPRDVGPYVFGSDHHPLLARVDFSGALHA